MVKKSISTAVLAGFLSSSLVAKWVPQESPGMRYSGDTAIYKVGLSFEDPASVTQEKLYSTYLEGFEGTKWEITIVKNQVKKLFIPFDVTKDRMIDKLVAALEEIQKSGVKFGDTKPLLKAFDGMPDGQVKVGQRIELAYSKGKLSLSLDGVEKSHLDGQEAKNAARMLAHVFGHKSSPVNTDNNQEKLSKAHFPKVFL